MATTSICSVTAGDPPYTNAWWCWGGWYPSSIVNGYTCVNCGRFIPYGCTHSCPTTTSGTICLVCGLFIPNGTYHFCSNIDNYPSPEKKWKYCPHCGKELK